RSRHSVPHAFSKLFPGLSLPQGYLRPSFPRAAYSHCASVGRYLSAHLQYRSACSQSTQLIGCRSLSVLSPLQNWLHSLTSAPSPRPSVGAGEHLTLFLVSVVHRR